MTKVAIIGAGAVGATAAYYISKSEEVDVTVFDYGLGQATKAAAGIISPWFSKRRNKAWYRMARLGADFYQILVEDLKQAGQSTDFYQQTGVFILKRDESKLEELYDLALSRREESPLIGELKILSKNQANTLFPDLEGFGELLYASGGARVEGEELTTTLLAASGVPVISEKVDFEVTATDYLIQGQHYDKLILATGAWLGEILEKHGYRVDVRPQKGQLRDYYFDNLATDIYPVVMPEGELDIIPFNKGEISMGASHENDMGFDLAVDYDLLNRMEQEAQAYFPRFSDATEARERVGIRAYTSDFSPFYGEIPDLPNVFVASGLGSTGLTVGPLIGHELAMLILGQEGWLAEADYPVCRYISPTKG